MNHHNQISNIFKISLSVATLVSPMSVCLCYPEGK